MSSFTAPLHLEPLDEKTWMLVQDFKYYIGKKNSNRYVRVPAGFKTDFASTPRILWSLLPPWGQYGKAAIVHDFLCIHKEITNVDEDGYTSTEEISRKEVDKIFLESMKVLGVNRATRYAMYFGVRAYAILLPNRV